MHLRACACVQTGRHVSRETSTATQAAGDPRASLLSIGSVQSNPSSASWSRRFGRGQKSNPLAETISDNCLGATHTLQTSSFLHTDILSRRDEVVPPVERCGTADQSYWGLCMLSEMTLFILYPRISWVIAVRAGQLIASLLSRQQDLDLTWLRIPVAIQMNSYVPLSRHLAGKKPWGFPMQVLLMLL